MTIRVMKEIEERILSGRAGGPEAKGNIKKGITVVVVPFFI